MEPEERGFLKAIEENPNDTASRLAYADWLEEKTRPYEALFQRIKAGVSEARYKVRRKSDGLFSDARRGWSNKGAKWNRLDEVRGHFAFEASHPRYNGDTPWEDVEVVVFEVRVQVVTALA